MIFWVQNVGIWRIWGLFLSPPLHPLGPRFSWQFGIQILLRRGIEAELLRLMLSRLVRFACVHQSLSPLVVSVHLTQGTNSTSIRGRKFNQRTQILHLCRQGFIFNFDLPGLTFDGRNTQLYSKAPSPYVRPLSAKEQFYVSPAY